MLHGPNGEIAVLKQPYTERDLLVARPGRPAPPSLVAPELVDACRRAAEELAEREGGLGPPVDAVVELDDLRVGLVFAQYESALTRVLRGCPLADVVGWVHLAARRLAEAGQIHGNLHPGNLLFDERGELFLSDAVLAPLREHHARLADLADVAAWMPPEARRSASGPRSFAPTPTSMWDTWALCQLVFAAAWSAGPASGSPEAELLAVAVEGLDRAAAAAFEQAASDRYEADGLNPRFRERAVGRLRTMLARGLSIEVGDSPPYRFVEARDLAERAGDAANLARPRVLEVGRLLFPPDAPDGAYTTVTATEDVEFGVTVACTNGITEPDDLVCHVQMTEVGRPPSEGMRLEDVRPAGVAQRPGRVRYQIAIPHVPRARFRVAVGFGVRGSEDSLTWGMGDIEIRTPDGYVTSGFAGDEAPPGPGVHGLQASSFRSAPPRFDDTVVPHDIAGPEVVLVSVPPISALSAGSGPWDTEMPPDRPVPASATPTLHLTMHSSSDAPLDEPPSLAGPRGRAPIAQRRPPAPLPFTEPVFIGAVVTACVAAVGIVTLLLRSMS